MKIRVLTIIFLVLSLTFFGQETESKDCFEIKYLDFFGLENQEIVKWPKSEISGLLAMDFEKDRNGSTIKTSFIIPLIIYQLKEYHPNCKSNIDTTYLNQISELYFKIRGLDNTILNTKSTTEKIEFLLNDFYSQVENIKYLPKMTMTFDDGPFYGVEFESKTELKPIKKHETEFGFLTVSKIDNKTILTSKDNKGKTIWQKSITGLSDRNLTELHFTENPIEYNSVATVAHMYSEGERFTLYLKKDGSFMYYFHSW
ncbi:hypothetical protein [Psychroserpens ponticola]|uniref:Uncharacterized protein n=1 Tax=Psychroserpens ponticola TaxID=2932268 RepID=A0ABY7S2B2_9FLAO|nr:hypothetical protein [Psychroserpens ponticola]WCO03477.1 hypothetical protein MUN68_008205 [Psychroserpens ponticola]